MKKKMWTLLLCMTLVLTALAGCGQSDNAQGGSEPSSGGNQGQSASDYPSQTIEIYVPANPGGQTDASARVIAEHMKKYLGGDIVVINQAAGGGTVAFETVKNAKPDGYKLLYFHQALHTARAAKKMDDDTRSLRAIGIFSAVDEALVVSAKAPWNNLKDFVEDAKNNPGKLKFGAELGGTTHFMGGMLAQAAGIELQILDVGSESDRVTALLGGQIDMAVTSVSNALNYLKSGDFKILAVISEERSTVAPEIPTAKEQGYDVVFPIVHTLYGPKDLPDSIVEAWNKATIELAKDPAYNEALKKIGQFHVLKNGKEAEEFSNSELDKILQLGQKLGF